MDASTDSQITTLKKACPAEFEITDILGSGGYGIVAKAHDKMMSRTVAIKFLNRIDNTSKSQLKKFQLEGKALARLKHPNIVSVLQMGFGKDDQPFIVYEYLEGKTLAQYLKEHHALAPQVLSSVFEQVLSAISHAHSMGVVHGDISPANIILLNKSSNTNSGALTVKIVDFGLARIVESSDMQELARTATNTTQTLHGNPFYMSPEQCRGELADERSDYYSIACVFYECLTGHPPFEGETPLHVLYKHLNQTPELAKDLPESLKELLKKSLAKEKENRPENTTQFRMLVQRAIEDLKKRDLTQRFLGKKQILAALGICLIASLTIIGLKDMIARKNQLASTSSAAWKEDGKKHTDMQMSPETRLKRLLKEYVENGIDTLEETAQFSDRIAQVLPSLKVPDMQFLGYANKGLLELRLGRTKDCKNSFELAYKYSLVDGQESLHSALPLFYLASEEYYRNPNHNKSLLKSRFEHVVALLRKAKMDDTGHNPPRLELGEDLEVITVNTFEGNSLVKIAELSNNFEDYKKYGEEAIAVYKDNDTVAHCHPVIMDMVNLYTLRKHPEEARILLDKLEKSLRTETSRDPLDDMSAARALGAWYGNQGEKRKEIEICKLGTAIGDKAQRQNEGIYANLKERIAAAEKER